MEHQHDDKANITWLKDESLEGLNNLPSPDVIAREIVEDLPAALAEFEAVAAALEAQLAESVGGGVASGLISVPSTRRIPSG
jgi:hypothetical protein